MRREEQKEGKESGGLKGKGGGKNWTALYLAPSLKRGRGRRGRKKKWERKKSSRRGSIYPLAGKKKKEKRRKKKNSERGKGM